VDYQTKLNEVRYRTNTVNSYDASRMDYLRMAERRQAGSMIWTFRRLFSQSPYYLLPGGYLLAYFVAFERYSMAEVVGWYAVLMLGLVGPLMLWMGVFGVFQKLRDNTRFGLGWVVLGMAPVAILVTVATQFTETPEMDLRGIFDEARRGRDAWEAVRWAVENRWVPLAAVLGFGAGAAGAIVLLVQGLRRHSADVSRPVLEAE